MSPNSPSPRTPPSGRVRATGRRRARRGALTVCALALSTALAGCGAGAPGSSSAPAQPASARSVETGFDGAELPGPPSAPAFRLLDIATGRPVTLGSYRGRVVVLTFLYSTCGAPCVLIAQQVRGALDELEERHLPQPAALIVSVDPRADTPARARRFLARVSLTGRARYLTGTISTLRRVWHDYEIQPASAGRAAFEEFASVVLIDASGRERVLYQSEQLTPEGISHDIGKLEGG